MNASPRTPERSNQAYDSRVPCKTKQRPFRGSGLYISANTFPDRTVSMWALSLPPSLRVVIITRRRWSSACDLVPVATSTIRLERNLHRQKVICRHGITFLYPCLRRLCHKRCSFGLTCWNLAGRCAPRLAGLSLDLTNRGYSFARARTRGWCGESAA